jgi:hypothetical protein
MSRPGSYLAKCINLLQKRVLRFPVTLKDEGFIRGRDCHVLEVKRNNGMNIMI